MLLYLISLLSFLLPTQIGYHFDIFQSSVMGFSIDYLTPTLYLSDIVALLVIALGYRQIKLNKRLLIILLTISVCGIINIFKSDFFIPTVYRWVRIVEYILLGLTIYSIKGFDSFKHFVKPLSFMMIIANFLGIFQLLNKGSIQGAFYYLGERSFSFLSPNVSPYPYSTFSHPNSYAGFLLVFIIYLFEYRKKFNFKYYCLVLMSSIINLITTNSLNVYIATILILLLKIGGSASFLFIPVDLSARFISHRIELMNASLKIIKENILFGVGLNKFIPTLAKNTNAYINSWELQPVHNIFLLVFSETGIFVLVIFIWVLFSLGVNFQILAITITGMSDHYWLTLVQNNYLLVYVISILYRKSSVSKIN